MDRMHRVIKWLLFAIILLILVLLFAPQIDSIAVENHYCLITQQPFNFKEISALPYQEIQPLDWNREVGFTELTKPPQLVYSILPGSCEHIIQVYVQNGDFYMMQFAEPRGRDGQPHPEHHAWVQP